MRRFIIEIDLDHDDVEITSAVVGRVLVLEGIDRIDPSNDAEISSVPASGRVMYDDHFNAPWHIGSWKSGDDSDPAWPA